MSIRINTPNCRWDNAFFSLKKFGTARSQTANAICFFLVQVLKRSLGLKQSQTPSSNWDAVMIIILKVQNSERKLASKQEKFSIDLLLRDYILRMFEKVKVWYAWKAKISTLHFCFVFDLARYFAPIKHVPLQISFKVNSQVRTAWWSNKCKSAQQWTIEKPWLAVHFPKKRGKNVSGGVKSWAFFQHVRPPKRRTSPPDNWTIWTIFGVTSRSPWLHPDTRYILKHPTLFFVMYTSLLAPRRLASSNPRLGFFFLLIPSGAQKQKLLNPPNSTTISQSRSGSRISFVP